MTRSRTYAVLASVLTAGAMVLSAGAAAAGTTRAAGTTVAPPEDPAVVRTREREIREVDAVPTPTPRWFDCSPIFGPGNECTTVQLPQDYDRRQGPTTGVAVLRHPATDQSRKIGTLFVNPGGPGGSGVQIAAVASFFLGPEVVERFDIVGFDPRGTNFSDNVRCWQDVGEQAADLDGFRVPFPVTDEEEAAYVASSRAFGHACSTTGQPLSSVMSTGLVARDMDVLRRMVGDPQLTYLGFSYGSFLGNVYANMFPGRVRALAIDGVLDPLAWTGTRETADVPQTDRLRSGEGSARAFEEILRRCEVAGPEFCRLAGLGDPQEIWAEVRARLLEAPLPIPDPFTGEDTFELTYQLLVLIMLGDMYAPIAPQLVDADLSMLYALLQEPGEPGSDLAATQEEARLALHDKVRAAQAQAADAAATQAQQRAALGFAFPYDNPPEAFQSVLCADGRNPADAALWPDHADRADDRAPDFGRLWSWASAPCASRTWWVRDEDAYRGPFTTRTANPVLVVGNLWDPATNYDGAVTVASLLPNSRLLSSDSWGHTAYGTSECVTAAVDTYLLTGRFPPVGTRCVGDAQPFATPLEPVPGEPGTRSRTVDPGRLPPVVPPLPGALPRS